MRARPLPLALLGTVLATLAWGQGSHEDARDALYAALHSEDTPRREAAAREILEERRLLIDVLCEIVREKTAGDYDYQKRRVTESAIRLLGQIRAAEAAPLLARKLTFLEPSPKIFTLAVKLPFREGLPAVTAMIDIGQPAIEPILQEVEARNDTSLPRYAALTLDCIMGTDPAVALIDARLKDRGDADATRRLRRLRERIDENERLRIDTDEQESVAD